MNQSEKKKWLDDFVIQFRDFGCYIPVANYIACQFALESDFGQSNIAKKNYNYCGMQFPSIRFTLAFGVQFGHANYYTRLDCIRDYFLLLAWNHFTQKDLNDLDLFKQKLKKSNYCPSSDYIGKIDALFNQYFCPTLNY